MTPEISARGFVTPEHYTDTDPPDETQVAWCVEWLSSAPRTKRVYKGISSCGLKHLAEKLNPSRVGGGYCSNGSLLMAARNLGITMELCDYDSPPACIAAPQGHPNQRVRRV